MSKPNPHVENLVFSESVQLGWEWDGMGFTMGMESPLTTALKIVHWYTPFLSRHFGSTVETEASKILLTLQLGLVLQKARNACIQIHVIT